MTGATMEALLLTALGEVGNRRVPVPGDPEGDGVLIRVTRAGICGSELEAVATRSPRRVPPLIMGHEFAGRLEAVGPQAAGRRGWRVGERVVPNPLVPCLRCRSCARGLTNACPNRTLLGLHRDGGHAEWVLLQRPPAAPHPGRPVGRGAATAEPLAVAVHGVRLLGGAGVLPRSIAVFGAGTIGLMALQAARLAGATTTLVLDVDAGRLEIARRLGATARSTRARRRAPARACCGWPVTWPGRTASTGPSTPSAGGTPGGRLAPGAPRGDGGLGRLGGERGAGAGAGPPPGGAAHPGGLRLHRRGLRRRPGAPRGGKGGDGELEQDLPPQRGGHRL